MAYQAAQAKSGPVLFVSAAAALAASVFAIFFLISMLLAATNVGAIRELGSISLIALTATAPLAIITSMFVRCQSCNKLLLPLVYDGKTLFAAKSPSALKIGRTAFQVVLHRRADCPHCGAEAEV